MNAAIPITLLATFAGMLPAQTPEPAPKPTWPKLAEADAARARSHLRKIDDETPPEALAEIEEKLVAFGAGMAPVLLRALGDSSRDVRKLSVRALDRVLRSEHAPLLLPYLRDDEVERRRYASLRLARFHAELAREPFRHALADDKEDAAVAFHAALGLAGLGELDAMEPVFERCRADWREVGDHVSEVMRAACSPDTLFWLTARMRGADEQTVITCLRLMRSMCPKDHAGVIAIHLDAEQHAVKKEAINALRAVVDGAEPLENLSVFQAIQMSQKWQERMR